MELTTVTFWSSLLEIFVINLILSGDNAVVIALATLHLQEKDRKKGIFWGTFGAVTLRLGLTLIAVVLLSFPFIQIIGGILLILIALKLIKGDDLSTEEQSNAVYRLKDAIKTIIVADLLMSLDNVLAVAGAAGGNILLLLLGLAISIPIVIFGSTFLSALMRKQPWLIFAGAGLLGYTSGKMILHDQAAYFITDVGFSTQLLPLILAAGVITTGFYWKTKRNRPAPESRIKENGHVNPDPLRERALPVFAPKKKPL